jgi:hypothetical protein
MITFPGVKISRDEALRMIATLKTAAGIVPIPNGDVTYAHVMAVGMRGLAEHLRCQLDDTDACKLAHEFKPLRAMVSALHDGEPSLAEIEERLAIALAALRSRERPPH